MRAIPPVRPCFHFKSCVYAYVQVCRGTPKCLRFPGRPKVHSSSQKHRGPGIPRTDRGDLWPPRGTTVAVTTHAWDTHLLPQESGHQQITAQMSVQRLEPPAFSGSRLENALRREPRSQQYSAPLTFSYLNTYLNKSKRYQIRRNILLLVTVIGTCHVMGDILLSKAAFKNPRSKVFSFLCENSRVFEKVNLKKKRKVKV